MLLSKSSSFPTSFSSYIIIPREVSVSLFYTKLFQSLIQVHLFARDAHPRITSANVLYINIKITLAKFLRSTNVKQRQTLSNIKLAADKSFFAHSYCFNWYFLYLCICVYLLQRDSSFRSTKIRSHPARIFSFFRYSIAASCIPCLDWRNRYFLVRFSRFVFQGGNNIPAHPPNRFSLGVR